MNTLEDVLALVPEQWHARWNEIDGIVRKLPSRAKQISAWEMIRDRLHKAGSLKGSDLLKAG